MNRLLSLITLALLPVSLLSQAWVQTNGPYGGNVREICSTRLGVLYCATDGGVYRSTNNGANWSEIQFSSPYYNSIDYVYANDEGFIFIGTDSDNFVSRDGGTTWASSFDFYEFYSVVSDSNGILYASTENQGIRVSIDNGNTWNTLLQGTSNGGRLYYSELHRLYHATSEGLFEIQLADSLFMTQLTTIQFQDFSEGAPGEFLGGNQDGIVSFSSDTGRTWNTWATTDLFGQWSYYFASGFDSAGRIYVATHYNVHTSDDQGITWNTTFWSYERAVLTFHLSTQGDFFLGTLSGGMYRFEPLSEAWLEVNEGINSGRVWSIAANAEGTVIVVQAERIWRSKDRGETWEQLPGEFTFLRTVWFDSQGILYVAHGDSLYSSIDEGTSWSRRPYPAGTSGSYIIRNSKDELLFLAAGYFIKMKSDGTILGQIQLPTPTNHITDFSIAKNGDLFIIAGQNDTTGNSSRLFTLN